MKKFRFGVGGTVALCAVGGLFNILLPLCFSSAVINGIADDPQSASASAEKRALAGSASSASAVTPPGTAVSEIPSSSNITDLPSPVVETRRVSEIQQIPFASTTIDDPGLAKGTRQVRTAGVPGAKTMVYEVTIVDGVQTTKRLISETVTQNPITQVTAVGTKQPQPQPQPQTCDPNYSGCVPIASDVDCKGGSGNGPAYVSGPVRVVGSDIYDLDRDGDGLACEN